MRLSIFLIALLAFTGCTSNITSKTRRPIIYKKHSFQSVWNEVLSDPLASLPQNTVSFGKLSKASKNIILSDAKRTLVDHRDIIEPFDKLAHPNGVCLKGNWEIYKDNPYSGYFKKRSKALVIARASSALSETKSGKLRAFGMAIKIFPTMIKTRVNKEHTANFFVIDDLGGTDAKYYTDVAMTNEPDVSITSEVLKNLLYSIKVAGAFSSADKHSGIRQLYEVSELGEKNKKHILTPKWIKISVHGKAKTAADDFRDEFKMKHGQKMVFDIAVASKVIDKKKDWKTIGNITFTESVISNTCDHRLHFHHPVWRDDLIYQ